MDDIPGYVRYCLNTGKLLFLAILVSGGIVLQILVSIVSVLDFIHLKDDNFLLTFVLCCQACALYNNWWPMLSGEIKHHLNMIPVYYIFVSFHCWDC
jgi:hypothetical protein